MSTFRCSLVFLLTCSVGAFLLQAPEAYCLSGNFLKSDSALLAQIQAEIAANPALFNPSVQVEVIQGKASFKGIAVDKNQAKALITLAASTAGIQGVNISGLSLIKGRLTSDDLLNSLVIGIFYREGLMGPLSHKPAMIGVRGTAMATYTIPAQPIHLQVNTRDGIVYLSGEASDQAAIDKAIDLAKSIQGVREVKSIIKSDH